MEGRSIEYSINPSPPEFDSHVLQHALTHALGRVFGDVVYDPVDGLRVRKRKEDSEVSRPF